MMAPISQFTATEIQAPTGASPPKPFPLHSAVILDSRMQFLLVLNWDSQLAALGTACWMTWLSLISRYPNLRSRRSWPATSGRSFHSPSCLSSLARLTSFSVGRGSVHVSTAVHSQPGSDDCTN